MTLETLFTFKRLKWYHESSRCCAKELGQVSKRGRKVKLNKRCSFKANLPAGLSKEEVFRTLSVHYSISSQKKGSGIMFMFSSRVGDKRALLIASAPINTSS